jgi:cyclohexyl-isocyanide hydratase
MHTLIPSRPLPVSTRRGFLKTLSLISAGGLLPTTGSTGFAQTSGRPLPESPIKGGSEVIGILIYPGFTAIDAFGPEYILSGMMGAQVKLVAKSKKPVKCETGFEVIPAWTFKDCPKPLSLLIIPGGTAGTLDAIKDRETLAFIQKAGGSAEMVGSVCTGSLLLGAAGLLDGYKATSHWQTVELLPLVGAQPSDKRVVFDRNRVTAAGVTAGLDFALELVKHYRGDFYAKGMQLLAEYDPQPPFPKAGNPKTADTAVVGFLNDMHKPFVDLFAQTITTHRFPPSPEK